MTRTGNKAVPITVHHRGRTVVVGRAIGQRFVKHVQFSKATADQAERIRERHGFAGTGVIFCDADDFLTSEGHVLVGVDVDGCVAAGQLSADAQAIIDRLNSRTEYSPSGEGVHVCISLRPEGRALRCIPWRSLRQYAIPLPQD